jgi:hypothetical protein
MSASAGAKPQPQPASNPMTRLNVLRALVKAVVLFLLFNVAYRSWQPVQTGSLPTLYNHAVNGRVRLIWNKQTNLSLLLNDHIIQQATKDTWNVVMLGSSETHGGEDPDGTTVAELDALGLQAADGRPVRVYNLAIPSGDVWKDLIVAELLLQAGLPIDLIVLNTHSYAFQTDYPHSLVIRNPVIAADVIGRYQLNPSLLEYVGSPGTQTLWTERAALSAWLFDQSQAAAWQIARFDYGGIDRSAAPLTVSLGAVSQLPISRGGFLGAFRDMAERYQVGLLVVNVPRPFDEDAFDGWLQTQAQTDGVSLLDCEFIFPDPFRFSDGIHFVPDTYPLYARILAQHLSRDEMTSAARGLPLRLPADFDAPEETCVVVGHNF